MSEEIMQKDRLIMGLTLALAAIVAGWSLGILVAVFRAGTW